MTLAVCIISGGITSCEKSEGRANEGEPVLLPHTVCTTRKTPKASADAAPLGFVSNALSLYLDGLVEVGDGIVVLDQGMEGGHLRLTNARTDAVLEGKEG